MASEYIFVFYAQINRLKLKTNEANSQYLYLLEQVAFKNQLSTAHTLFALLKVRFIGFHVRLLYVYSQQDQC